MAFPITGSLATISSAGGNLADLLINNVKINEVTIAVDSDQYDVTELTGSYGAAQRIAGLRTGTMSFSGYHPKTGGAKVGNTGSVTGPAGAFIAGWKLDIDFGEQEITKFGDTVKRWMPSGLYEWNGSYTAHALDSAAVALTDAANAAATSATLTTCTGGAVYTGDIYVTGLSHAVRKPEKQALEYTFNGTGNLAESGTAILGTNLTAGPTWDATGGDGTPDTNVVFTTYTGRTYTAAAFLKSISIESAVNGPVRVSGQLRLAYTITTA